jgi:hypothetical protein
MTGSSRLAVAAAAACAALALTSTGFAAPAPAAGSSVQEVVVTGSRMSEFDSRQTPHVVVNKRADNLLVEVRVVCDTRDRSQRLNELRATLRNMVKAAQADHSIELGQGDEVVGGFDETMIEEIIKPDSKADTSYAALLLKTPVAASDSFDAASRRIRHFIAKVDKVGRSEVLINGDWQLSVVGIPQYRPQILAAVAEDAKRAAADFGDGYGVHVTGLEHPIQWYQSGPLDLALYIPYKLEIEPLKR